MQRGTDFPCMQVKADMVDKYFQPLPLDEDITLVSQGLPHARSFGLISHADLHLNDSLPASKL